MCPDGSQGLLGKAAGCQWPSMARLWVALDKEAKDTKQVMLPGFRSSPTRTVKWSEALSKLWVALGCGVHNCFLLLPGGQAALCN